MENEIQVSPFKYIPYAWKPKGKYHHGLNSTHYILSADEYEEYELIVTIHGVDGFSYVFDKFHADVLQRNKDNTNKIKYKILQYDLIGRGHSKPSSNNRYTEIEHVEQLHSLIEHLGFHKFKNKYHVVGLSMGGAIATFYCEKYYQEVKSVTLLAPAGLMNLPQLKYIRAISLIRWLVKYPTQHLEKQPYKSRAFYDKTGVFEERFYYMVKMKIMAHENNPNQIESVFQCKLQFPLYDIDNTVKSIADIPNFRIHLIFGKCI